MFIIEKRVLSVIVVYVSAGGGFKSGTVTGAEVQLNHQNTRLERRLELRSLQRRCKVGDTGKARDRSLERQGTERQVDFRKLLDRETEIPD